MGNALGHTSDTEAGEHAEQLRSAVSEHMGRVEDFVTAIERSMKIMDFQVPHSKNNKSGGEMPASITPTKEAPSSDKDQSKSTTARTVIGHETFGYVVHTDCGHNGMMDDSECRLLGLHMRAAGFGQSNCEMV